MSNVGRILLIFTLLTQSGRLGVTAGSSPPEHTNAKEGDFAQRIERILSNATYLDQFDDELFSDKRMREVLATPEQFRAEAEAYLKHNPNASEIRIRIAVLGMQCLKLDEYLRFVDALSAAERGRMSRWALFYSVVPGFEWSTRLALGYRDERIRRTLQTVSLSPNADKQLRSAIDRILDGTSAHAITAQKIAPALQCK